MRISLYYSGVPAVVDFAAMRDAVKKLGGDPARINPVVPVDLVIDHSVQVDYFRRYVRVYYLMYYSKVRQCILALSKVFAFDDNIITSIILSAILLYMSDLFNKSTGICIFSVHKAACMICIRCI